MLRIGKLTDYAVLILGELAKHPQQLLSASMIAQKLGLAVPTVSKILKTLHEAKLVSSSRGREGGYALYENANEISVVRVIEAMEGHLALTACCDEASLCSINASCTMRQNWRKINKMVYSMLEKMTITDLLNPLPLPG